MEEVVLKLIELKLNELRDEKERALKYRNENQKGLELWQTRIVRLNEQITELEMAAEGKD